MSTRESASRTDLLESGDDVTGNRADQGGDVIHEALGEAVLAGRLQPVGEVQVLDDALDLQQGENTKRGGERGRGGFSFSFHLFTSAP